MAYRCIRFILRLLRVLRRYVAKVACHLAGRTGAKGIGRGGCGGTQEESRATNLSRVIDRVGFFKAKYNALDADAEPLERFIHLLAASLDAPVLITEGLRGFRFKQPNVKHFCLIKLVRAVSALNAAIWLGRAGFTQEIGVLMRTMIECTTESRAVAGRTGSVGVQTCCRTASCRRDPVSP